MAELTIDKEQVVQIVAEWVSRKHGYSGPPNMVMQDDGSVITVPKKDVLIREYHDKTVRVSVGDKISFMQQVHNSTRCTVETGEVILFDSDADILDILIYLECGVNTWISSATVIIK